VRVAISGDRLERRPVALLAPGVAFLLTACSGDISGSVYVTMKSGDVKRGADVSVVLVGEQFMAEWTKAAVAYKSAHLQARTAYEGSRARSDQAFQERLSDIRAGSRSSSAYDEEASERAMEAARRVDSVSVEWLNHTMKLIQWATVKVARTDVNGHYEFKSVRRGKYYITATHKVFDNDLFWLVPVDVHGIQTVDLSNSNAGSWFAQIRN
jgi:hypothetical protein